MRLTAEVIGQRVTVRHRDGDGARDVVGRVQAVADTVTIERRDGSIAQVVAADIILWRVVPDRPVRSRRARSIDAESLARIASRGWPAVESEQLGDWELRAAGGFTGRANSALIVGDPGMTFDAATDRVVGWYTDRGLRPQVQVIAGTAAEAMFLDHGWQRIVGTRPGAIVQVADLRAPLHSTGDVVISEMVTEEWLAMYPRIEPALVEAARHVLSAPTRVGFATIGSPAVAIGRVVVTGEWAGIAAVEVSPEHRRRGLGRRIVSSLLSHAQALGADKAYLQTMKDNDPALALYEPFGFINHHKYLYLTQAAHSLSS